jgi:hypothetical protein
MRWGSDHRGDTPQHTTVILFHRIVFRNRNRTNHGHQYLPIDIISAPHHRNSLKRLQQTAMRSDDYRHLRETFVEMAFQRPDSPEVARWLSIAHACLELERQPYVEARRPGRPAAHVANEQRRLRPQRPAAQQDKTVRRYGTAPPRSNVPNSTAASIYRKLGAYAPFVRAAVRSHDGKANAAPAVYFPRDARLPVRNLFVTSAACRACALAWQLRSEIHWLLSPVDPLR